MMGKATQSRAGKPAILMAHLGAIGVLCAACVSSSCGDTPAPFAKAGEAGAQPRAPAHIVAGYFPYWTLSPPRIRDASPQYNVIYIFAGQDNAVGDGRDKRLNFSPPGDGRGAASNFPRDVQYARGVQGRKIILSIDIAAQDGGFPTRAESQKFVDQLTSFYGRLGGFDGLDWSTFGGPHAVDIDEITWISLQLKRKFPGFVIAASPAPWSAVDKEFCRVMVERGAMDYAAPQYYGGSNLADPEYVLANLREWIALLGQSHVVVGFGINNAANYMNGLRAGATWTKIESSYPAIRGVSNWDINADERQGWVFAKGIGSLVKTKS
ncbi:MAG TPA: hypothetical protein VIF60_06030 [Burkholderiaceae bacterium]|jgi:hypothetical protein